MRQLGKEMQWMRLFGAFFCLLSFFLHSYEWYSPFLLLGAAGWIVGYAINRKED